VEMEGQVVVVEADHGLRNITGEIGGKDTQRGRNGASQVGHVQASVARFSEYKRELP
jgi:hypothetical protein